MSRRALLHGSAALGAGAALVWSLGGPLTVAAEEDQAVTPPDTAAGRRLTQWLAAINAGDVDALLAYHHSIAPDPIATGRATFDLIERKNWGQVELHGVLESSDDRIIALLFTSLSEQWLRIEIGGEDGMVFMPAKPPPGAVDSTPLSDAGMAQELRRYLEKLAAADVFSGAVLLAHEGTPFFTAACGRANQATDESNRVSTRFNLGSMNKMFTATSIAQLAERGRLAFTDTLAALLPDYPNQEVAAQISVHQLLTHTSGLGDFFGPRYMREKDSIRSPRDYFPLFAAEPLRFAPGTDWSYSNAGFIVLGAIVERISGQDYFEYVRQQVYGPAGMTRSDSFERYAAVPDLATGYAIPLPENPRDLRPEIALQPRSDNNAWLGPIGSPAGSGYSTVEDLLAFSRALLGNRLLSAASTELVLRGKADTMFGPSERYAYGFIDGTVEGTRVIGHGGGAPGISANLDIFPDRGVTAVVLSNYHGIARIFSETMRELVVRT